MERYRTLLAEVDQIATRLSTYYAPHLACRPGCSSCCQENLTVFEVEAARVSEAICALDAEMCERIRQQAVETRKHEGRGGSAACPLLVDDRCSIYESRPVICRTQGLPLLHTAEDNKPEVDFCPFNFTAPGATNDLDEEHLVPLDLLNQKLVLANMDYCRTIGLAPAASGGRIPMSVIILKAQSAAKS
jgi:hypothetical protein